MKQVLKNVRLTATALTAAIFLVGASPIFVASAQTAAPSATTSVALTEPTIKALQDALNKQGIAVKADGVMNDETRAAIKKYQSQHHLPVTGEADTPTLGKLGVSGRQGATPAAQAPQGQGATMGQAPSGPPGMGQSAMQPGQMQGGMMNCPMMQTSMQDMMKMMQGMMQTMQTMQGQMQPGQMPPAAR